MAVLPTFLLRSSALSLYYDYRIRSSLHPSMDPYDTSPIHGAVSMDQYISNNSPYEVETQKHVF